MSLWDDYRNDYENLNPFGRSSSMIVKFKDVRIAFCQNLFTPGVVTAADTPKFSSTFLIPKDDPQIAKMRDALARVAGEKWGQKADAILKSLCAEGKVCFRDGDTKEQYDGYAGHMFINASSTTQPTVIDANKIELTETSGRVYAGCYVNVSLEVWAQDNQFGKRINAKLRAVQFVRDGDAFSGSAPASADEFDDLSADVDDLL